MFPKQIDKNLPIGIRVINALVKTWNATSEEFNVIDIEELRDAAASFLSTHGEDSEAAKHFFSSSELEQQELLKIAFPDKLKINFC